MQHRFGRALPYRDLCLSLRLETAKQVRRLNTTLVYIENSLRGYVADNELREIALWIAEEATGLSRSEILCKDTTIIPNLEIILQRVRRSEPVQYIFSRTYWGGMTLHVNSATLIPRPETWELIEQIKNHCGTMKNIRLLDIGTGTGCIAIALKRLFPDWIVEACDINETALQTARNNASNNNANIRFFHCNILTDRLEQYDIIVSNPPYITESEKTKMDARVLDYEPHTALFVPDNDPLLFYRMIATNHQPSKFLFFEINERMGQPLLLLLKDLGYNNIVLRQDIFGKDRVIIAESECVSLLLHQNK